MDEYKSGCIYPMSYLSRNKHTLLIQTNWIGGPSEISVLLFLKRNAVLLFSNRVNKTVPSRERLQVLQLVNSQDLFIISSIKLLKTLFS